MTKPNSPPLEGCVQQIYCDAAVSLEDSVVALIAREWRGNPVFAFSCKVNTILVQVEAEVLRWATSIAVKYNLVNVIVRF